MSVGVGTGKAPGNRKNKYTEKPAVGTFGGGEEKRKTDGERETEGIGLTHSQSFSDEITGFETAQKTVADFAAEQGNEAPMYLTNAQMSGSGAAVAAPRKESIFKAHVGEKERSGKGVHGRIDAANILIYIILTVSGILWVLPICYLLYTAFRVTPETGIINSLFPAGLRLGFGNFVKLFTSEEFPFGVWLKNTFVVAAASCLLSTLFVLMTAYALSRLRFRFRKTIMNILLVLGMFPGFMSMIAVYFILKAMNLTDSLTALVLVYSGGAALGYYICKGFFDTVPRAMEEAAVIDGANRLGIFLKITLPMAKPVIVYTVLTSFISPWCDFIFVNTIISDRAKYTVALGLYRMINSTKSGFNDNFTVFCAGASVVGVIITVLFMSMQKYYVEGVTGGSVKG